MRSKLFRKRFLFEPDKQPSGTPVARWRRWCSTPWKKTHWPHLDIRREANCEFAIRPEAVFQQVSSSLRHLKAKNIVSKKTKMRRRILIFLFKYFLGEFFLFFIFLLFFFVLYSTRLHLPPLRFHCVDGCWDRTQDRCNWCIDSQTL